MSVSLSLRRFRPDNLPDCVERVIGEVPSRVHSSEYHEEVDAGVLVDLGEQWQVVQAALAGTDDRPTTIGYQAVLGGEFLGRTQTEIVVFLDPDSVRRLAEALSSGEKDGAAWVTQHLDAVEMAHGAAVDGDFRRWLATRIDTLTTFYESAAIQGDGVVKVAFS